MTTEKLIEKLSQQPRSHPLARPVLVISMGVLAAVITVGVLTLAWLGLRPDIAQPLTSLDHSFFATIVFAVSLASIAIFVVRDLSIPGRQQRIATPVVAIPFAALAALAAHEIGSTSWDGGPVHLQHENWITCLWQTSLLAVPAYVILAVAVRSLAPTNLRRAGMFVGLLSAGIAALGYVLHAPESDIIFSAVVYGVSAIVMAFFGASVGYRLLRW